MAFLKSYSDDAAGVGYPQSVWLPRDVQVNDQTETGCVVFYGYADMAAAIARKRPIGTRTYQITPENYGPIAYSMPNSVNFLLYQIASAAYALASTDPFWADAVNVPFPPE